MIAARYVDHTMTSPLQMALAAVSAKTMATELRSRGLLLVTTCLRTEVYGEYDALMALPVAGLWGMEPRLVTNTVEVAQRLAELASGMHSQIVGEDYIADQLDRALEDFDHQTALAQLARFAIDLGLATKRRHGFRAMLSYDGIVKRLLSDRFASDSDGSALYIVGAGMLGRDLVQSGVGRNFGHVAIVTRNPKTLRRRLRQEGLPYPQIERPDEISNRKPAPNAVVIATSEVTADYAAEISRMARSLKPRLIIDLSSVPVPLDADVGEKVVTMYGSMFLRLVDENNALLVDKIPAVRGAIRSNLEFAANHLRTAA